MPAPTPRFRDSSRPGSNRPRIFRWFFAFLLIALLAAGGVYWFVGPRIWVDHSGLHLSDSDAAVRHVVWAPPASLGERINTEQQEYEPCVSADGSELYFVRGRTGGGAHIYLSHRADNLWSTPVPLDPVNGPTDDLGPRLSADAKLLFFYSDRPGGFGGYDLWAARRNQDRSWSTPFNLGSAINTEFNEFSPDPTPDGQHLIFATNRTAALREQSESWHATIRQTNTTDYDLWIAELDASPTGTRIDVPPPNPASTIATPPDAPSTDSATHLATQPNAPQVASPGQSSISPRVFKPAQEIPGINSTFAEGGSCMSPAGDFLYFSSNRPGGYGKFDLYRCPVHDWTFGRVENLGPTINTADNEMDPMAALGGYRLYFDSDRPGSKGGYDLYTSESREVLAARLGHALPHLGWSGVAMLASICFMIPLVMTLRTNPQRLTPLQLCIILSVLFHVVLSFGLSFVMVSQQVRQYVKRETGVDLALSLPRTVELALSVRNPRSSEGPQAAAPKDLDVTPLPIDLPRDRPALKPDAPSPSVAGRDTPLEVASPQFQPVAPFARSDPIAPVAPPVASPNLDLAPLPTAHPVSAAEPQPTVAVPAAPVDPLLEPDAPTPRPALIIQTPSAPSLTPRLSIGPDPVIAGAPPAAVATEASTDNPWASIGDDPKANAPQVVSAGPRIALPAPSGPPSHPSPTEPDAVAARTGTGDPTGDQQLANRLDSPTRHSDSPLDGGGEQLGPLAAPAAGIAQDASLPPPFAATPPIKLAPPPRPDPPPPAVVAIAPPTLLPTPRLIPAPTPFHRAPEDRKVLVEHLGGTPDSEAAVARGLGFLARVQESDGRWTLMRDEAAPGHQRPTPHDMAYTGLALLAFLAQDHTPATPDAYREVVRKGLRFLLENQSPDGDLRGPPEFRGAASSQANLYDHAIATLAVSEAALLTHDPQLADAARSAARFIVRAQDADSGGWRYAPEQTGDTSVFGWQIMAMHSVELLGGFEIPQTTRRRALRYIQNAADPNHATLSSYQPGGSPTQTMTAEMLFARMLLGEKFSGSGIDDAVRFLSEYPVNPDQPDLYYWYYASLCMIQMHTPTWTNWNAKTRDTLIRLQHRSGFGDGAWEIKSKRVDRAGYIFTTAVATLTLEVYYRYAPALDNPTGP